MSRCVFVGLLAFVVGAGCLNMRRDEFGRALPRRPHWTLRHNAGDPHGLLRYNVIYVRLSDDKYHPGYKIVRFWPSGHYMYKTVNQIDVSEIDSPDKSCIGYYQVKSADEILVEVFTDINFGQYGYIRYRLDSNGDLLELSSGPSWTWWHSKYTEPFRYTPHYVGELKLQPDW